MRQSHRLPSAIGPSDAERGALGRLLSTHAPLVERMASNFARYGVEREDLVQEGYVSLLESARRVRSADDAGFTAQTRFWLRLHMIPFVLDTYGPVCMRKGNLRSLASRLGRADWSQARGRAREVAPSYEEQLVAAEERAEGAQALDRALAALSAEERAVVEALHLVGEPADAAWLAQRLGHSQRGLRLVEARALGRLLGPAAAGDDVAHVLVGGRRLRLYQRPRPRRPRARPVAGNRGADGSAATAPFHHIPHRSTT
jgi:RNA polymerase sigma factor (sigma-70 family)